MSLDDLFIELEWNSESIVNEFGEPDRFIYEYNGTIKGTDEQEESRTIGKFKAQYIDIVRSNNEYEDLFDVMDCHSSPMLEYFTPMFGENAPDFSDLVMQTVNYDIHAPNMLILDRIELLPEFRGKKIGLKVLRHMMTRFSAGAGVIALKAFPLQHEAHKGNADSWRSKLSLENLEPNQGLATERLKNHYEMLGFKRLPDTDIMIFPTALKIPCLN